MSLTWTFDVAVAAATLVAIANPLGALPVYLSLRGRPSDRRLHHTDAWHASAAVALCLLLSALAGMSILTAFGVSLAGFRAAGGLVVMLMAFGMVQGRHPFERAASEGAPAAESEMGIYIPLAVPLIAGPGAITTTITLAATPDVGFWGTCLAVLAVTAAVFCTIFFARLWTRLLGDFGLRLTTRALGLLVMAVGVQMAVTGIRDLWGG